MRCVQGDLVNNVGNDLSAWLKQQDWSQLSDVRHVPAGVAGWVYENGKRLREKGIVSVDCYKLRQHGTCNGRAVFICKIIAGVQQLQLRCASGSCLCHDQMTDSLTGWHGVAVHH